MNKYVVAVSGGVDSMYLAYKLATNNQAAAFVHINHHTRGAANDFEAHLVTKLGAQFTVPVYIFDYHHIKGNFQAEARKFRYQMLITTARKYSNKIAVAHHLDDQLENCLIPPHLVKSNLIKYRTKIDDCFVYRPLLGITKQEIYLRARELEIAFNEDVSNQSDNYDRNKRRIQLQNSESMHLAKLNYIVEYSKQKLVEVANPITTIERQTLSNQSTTYRYLKLYLLLKNYDSQITVKNRQLMAINQQIDMKKNSKYSVTNCNELFIGYDKIYMLASDKNIVESALLKNGENEFNGIVFNSKGNEGRIRTWQPGDKVKINNGHKKVSRLFIDHKIEQPLRCKWPIVINNSGEIIYIPQLWRK